MTNSLFISDFIVWKFTLFCEFCNPYPLQIRKLHKRHRLYQKPGNPLSVIFGKISNLTILGHFTFEIIIFQITQLFKNISKRHFWGKIQTNFSHFQLVCQWKYTSVLSLYPLFLIFIKLTQQETLFKNMNQKSMNQCRRTIHYNVWYFKAA